MSWVHTPSENYEFRSPLGPLSRSADTYDGSEYYSMAMYDAAVLLCSANLGAGQTAIFRVLEATTTTGTSKDYITGKTITLTGDAVTGSYETGVIDVSPSDLTDAATHHFIGARIITDATIVCEAGMVLFNPRIAGNKLIDPTTDTLHS